jgi:hypothetical protein
MVPEFRRLPKDLAQQQFREYYYRSLTHWLHWVGFLAFLAFIYLWNWFYGYFSNQLDINMAKVFEYPSLIIFTLIGWFVYGLIVTYAIRLMLRFRNN